MRSVHPRTPTALSLVAIGMVAIGMVAITVGRAPSARVASAAATEPPFEVSANGEYLVQFQPGSATRQAATRDLRAEGVELRQVATAVPISSATLTTTEAAAIASRDDVVAVAPNHQRHVADTEVDPPWGLDRTDQLDLPLDQQYSSPAGGGAGTTIYVIDSGINAAHEEFAGRLQPGATAILDGRGTGDCNGHGTHVAGSAAGTRYGVAKQATIVPVRVLDCLGRGTDEGVTAAIQWVIDHHTTGRAVANLSLGGPPSNVLDNMLTALIDDGVVVTVAAGNNGARPPYSPEACDYSPSRLPAALTVGATDSADTRSDFSNYGTCVDLFAPGSAILSAYIGAPDATAVMKGTSMAAPHVAGAAAVLWTEQPTLSSAQVEQLLLANATPNRLADTRAGTPNLLLHLPFGVAPPPPPPPPPTPVFTAAVADGAEPARRCTFSTDC